METLRRECNAFWDLIHRNPILRHLIKKQHEVTVFCPTDDVIDRLPASTKTRMSRDQKFLESILLYHVVSKRHTRISMGVYEELESSYVDKKTHQNVRLIVSNHRGVSVKTEYFSFKVAYYFHTPTRFFISIKFISIRSLRFRVEKVKET